jgi:hypothetical protein
MDLNHYRFVNVWRLSFRGRRGLAVYLAGFRAGIEESDETPGRASGTER